MFPSAHLIPEPYDIVIIIIIDMDVRCNVMLDSYSIDYNFQMKCVLHTYDAHVLSTWQHFILTIKGPPQHWRDTRPSIIIINVNQIPISPHWRPSQNRICLGTPTTTTGADSLGTIVLGELQNRSRTNVREVRLCIVHDSWRKEQTPIIKIQIHKALDDNRWRAIIVEAPGARPLQKI